MREYIEEGKHRGGVNEKRDFLSGSIVQDVIIDYVNSRGGDFFKTALCGICFDAVEISRWPKKSITPILCTWFNVPPWIRNLLTMISMLGVIPTKCKNQSLYLEPLLRMFNSLKPGRPGVRIRSPSGDLETWWAMIAVTINDMQGISSVNRQRQFPGKVMACNDCAVRGTLHRGER